MARIIVRSAMADKPRSPSHLARQRDVVVGQASAYLRPCRLELRLADFEIAAVPLPPLTVGASSSMFSKAKSHALGTVPCPRLAACNSLPAMPRRRLHVDLSAAVIARLQHRRAEGASVAALAVELGVSATTLKMRLKARPADGGSKTVPPEAKPRPVRMPHHKRPLPPRPASPEPSKQWLREMIAQAVRNTPHR
jgi:hypothetical protein